MDWFAVPLTKYGLAGHHCIASKGARGAVNEPTASDKAGRRIVDCTHNIGTARRGSGIAICCGRADVVDTRHGVSCGTGVGAASSRGKTVGAAWPAPAVCVVSVVSEKVEGWRLCRPGQAGCKQPANFQIQ